jgi:carboxylesterase
MFPFKPFQAPEHAPFKFEAGKPAALLVHGFPGTPSEMRPLGQALHQAGWTVYGLLLPGFGPQIEQLDDYRAEDWVEAVVQALETLKKDHAPVLLVGYSMGGGLALAAAAHSKPEALVLIAPFWQTSGWFWSAMPLMRILFPKIRPFKVFRMDINDPRTRQALGNFMPGADLDDPQVQQAVQEFEFPLSIMDEVRRVGQAARKATPAASMPALVLQGSQDEWVTPRATRQLLQALPGALTYMELPAAHDLLDPSKSAWERVTSSLLAYSALFHSGNNSGSLCP